MAINKESNVPGKSHLDKKKQVPLLYSTMLRRMYLKGPKSLAESEESPEMEKSVTEAVSAMKLESKEVSGSQKSLFRRDKSKTRDKDCTIM